MKRFINSERLYLRQFTKTDLTNLHNLNSDPEVMKFIKTPESLEETKQSLSRYINSYDGNGLGIWSIHKIEDDKFVGMYIFRENEVSNEIEIGYRIVKEYWGKGFASEMTNLIIDYAFDVLEIPELFAVVMDGNKGSEKVLIKAGFRKAGRTDKFYNAELNMFKLKQ